MRIDDIKKLHQKKHRQAMDAFLIEGEHLFLELAKAAESNEALMASKVYVSESYGAIDVPFSCTEISDKQMQKIADTKSPQGIVAVVPLSAIAALVDSDKLKASKEKTIYLHEVQDPGNLGTILRTLAWFGDFRCVLSPNSVDPFNPKVVRASMGAVFHVPIELDVSLSDLTQRFDHFACLDINGQALSAPSFKEHQCFIFGNEARGVPHESLKNLNVESFSIQGAGVLESLNLATAVNLCAYELKR